MRELRRAKQAPFELAQKSVEHDVPRAAHHCIEERKIKNQPPGVPTLSFRSRRVGRQLQPRMRRVANTMGSTASHNMYALYLICGCATAWNKIPRPGCTIITACAWEAGSSARDWKKR
mmetsp:Transcript_22956/g.58036  ORF Transcript_22956/g.58036 Transcript_22956/m.58036 type:complete len:118 (+) Transcript_22956:1634-1987(+)